MKSPLFLILLSTTCAGTSFAELVAERPDAPLPPDAGPEAVEALDDGIRSQKLKFNPRVAATLPDSELETPRLQAPPLRMATNDTARADAQPVPAAPGGAEWVKDEWRTSGNRFKDHQVSFLGTLGPHSLMMGAGGRPAFRITPNPFTPNLIGGHESNDARDGVIGAVVAGGGNGDLFPNRVEGDFGVIGGGFNNNRAGTEHKYQRSICATVGGGRNNLAPNSHSTVSGGSGNHAGGLAAAVAGGLDNRADGPYASSGGGRANTVRGEFAVVAGGHTNAAPARAAAVLGGERNRATGYGSSVLGGSYNEAGGRHGTVVGGSMNHAEGDHALAGGYRARARHPGTFVWADHADEDFASTGDGQFLVRASGNMGIDTTEPVEKLTVAGNIAPATDAAHSLGSPTHRWKRLYLGDTLDYAGSLQFQSPGGGGMIIDPEGNLQISGKVIARSFESAEGLALDPGRARPAPAGSLSAVDAAQIARRAVDQFALTTNTAFKGDLDGTASELRIREGAVGLSQLDTASIDRRYLPRPPAPPGRGQVLSTDAEGKPTWKTLTMPRAPVVAPMVQPGEAFEVRAPKGIRLRAHSEASVGASLAPGSHAMSMDARLSIRTNPIEVGDDLVLERLSRLSIQVWNLKTQAESVFHIGPTGQDFYELFGVGEDRDTINSGDANGVALSAIQGLYQVVQVLRQDLDRKDGEITALRQQLASLEKQRSDKTDLMHPGFFTAQTGADPDDWITLRDPEELVIAWEAAEVLDRLEHIRARVAEGFHAAGYLSFEAAPGLDPALCTQLPRDGLPCLWFGLYREPAPAPAGELSGSYTLGAWRESEDLDNYRERIGRIRDYIARGHTYQVNYTFELEAAFSGDAWPFFRELVDAQEPRNAAYLDTGDHALCSASPELFFRIDGDTVTARPMKGTSARGPCAELDAARVRDLRGSEKNRAENIMIVDMIRNDLGRIAETGSVEVRDTFHVETYRTLHQMTSTVTARSRRNWVEVLKAMYPCASITGAPKVRTLQIIRELEDRPRGIYTGCIGYVRPNGDANFNVAIRTAVVDRAAAKVRYGTGAGIVWDSDADAEYRECRNKAEILTWRPPRLTLFESLLWEPGTGWFLPKQHRARMRDSAAWLGTPFDPAGYDRALDEAVADAPAAAVKVRIFCDPDGAFRSDRAPASPATPVRVRLDDRPVDTRDVRLYHKTTDRARYTEAEARFPEYDEVILWNERGEITESTRANIAVRVSGDWYTPPRECGLLNGTFRSHLLEIGGIRERIISVSEMYEAEEVRLINAVRKWIPVDLAPSSPPQA